LASTALICFWSVVSGNATVGFTLKKTTDRGCPGFRAANARAASMAELIEPFMLFDASISSTVPMPSAEAAERTLRFLTGLPSSLTVTSSVVRTEPLASGSVRT
jgi:hypothetical protein